MKLKEMIHPIYFKIEVKPYIPSCTLYKYQVSLINFNEILKNLK